MIRVLELLTYKERLRGLGLVSLAKRRPREELTGVTEHWNRPSRRAVQSPAPAIFRNNLDAFPCNLR